MSVEVVCGINWGDEGKGRMVDYLARQADFVVRYQGGNNAGHTVVNERGKFALHLVPSGIFYDHVTCVLGPGMVINPEALVAEIESLESQGIDCSRLRVSDRAVLLFPFHRDEDAWEEERLGAKAYGSTRNGIAPAYADLYAKKAMRLGDLLFPEHMEKQLRDLVEWKSTIARGVYGKTEGVAFDRLLEWSRHYGERLKDRICDTSAVLDEGVKRGKRILFEAQLGALRDVHFGIYPFTTSSCCLAANAAVGGGLFGARATRVIGVMKAFSTCVGEGAFVTVMDPEEADALRESAGEYGATTGRPRTIGHFDAVASKWGVKLQEATELALTKLDSLSGRPSLKICTHYVCGNERTDRFPLTPVLKDARPVYEEVPGWSEDITGCRTLDALPRAARDYVLRIEALVGCRIRYVSVGPERSQLIDRGAA
jgi:adenylosuccinate synthase